MKQYRFQTGTNEKIFDVLTIGDDGRMSLEWHGTDRVLRYDGRKKMFRGISREEFTTAKEKAFYRRFIRSPYQAKSDLRRCYEYILDRSRPENGSYQKIAIYGQTWLYLCSPVYGHSYYNKARLMPIAGHEKECAFLIRVSRRVASM